MIRCEDGEEQGEREATLNSRWVAFRPFAACEAELSYYCALGYSSAALTALAEASLSLPSADFPLFRFSLGSRTCSELGGRVTGVPIVHDVQWYYQEWILDATFTFRAGKEAARGMLGEWSFDSRTLGRAMQYFFPSSLHFNPIIHSPACPAGAGEIRRGGMPLDQASRLRGGLRPRLNLRYQRKESYILPSTAYQSHSIT